MRFLDCTPFSANKVEDTRISGRNGRRIALHHAPARLQGWKMKTGFNTDIHNPYYISSPSAACKKPCFSKEGSLPCVYPVTVSAAARKSSNVDSSGNKNFYKLTLNVSGVESVL
jgi:hypothetical protein